MKPAIRGNHHLKIPVTSLAASRAFYERLFDLVVLIELGDEHGIARGVAYRPLGGVSLALSEDPGDFVRRDVPPVGRPGRATSSDRARDLRFCRSRLWESNPRPTHYENDSATDPRSWIGTRISLESLP